MNAPPLAHLRDALAERYVVERELGRGGMATVYLAQDLKHSRLVALKVLHPELANALGPDRFLREIRIAAGLNHPNILPLYDSGTWAPADHAPGLYYAMPFVEGESLRSRLTRECQLSVEDALRIAGDVAAALGYAHEQGVIHRDIKPENILLSGYPPHRGTLGDCQVFLADFGIAKALDAVGTERLTETGLSLGTPAYMSPEQASGEHHLDQRSDLYALGCVLYEMLAGQPPFTGATARAILARHALDPVPSLRSVRPTVPESLDRAVTRVLAKVPADRFATAEEFRHALTHGDTSTEPERGRRSRRRVLLPAGIAAVIGAAGLSLLLWPRHGPSGPPVDPHVLAVLPFRVAGADPALQYLQEGMVDLLAIKLTGEGGPRAADPRAVLSAWRRAGGSATHEVTPDAAVGIAQALGAGRLLDGGVIGNRSRVTLTASVIQIPSGSPTAQRGQAVRRSLHTRGGLFALTRGGRLSSQSGPRLGECRLLHLCGAAATPGSNRSGRRGQRNGPEARDHRIKGGLHDGPGGVFPLGLGGCVP